MLNKILYSQHACYNIIIHYYAQISIIIILQVYCYVFIIILCREKCTRVLKIIKC